MGRPGSRFIRPPGRRANSLQADTRSTLCPTSRPSRPWCNRSPARSSSARQLSVGCSASAAQRRLQVRQTRQAAGSAGRACPAGCTSVSVLAKVSNVRTLSSYTLRATHPSPTYSQSKPHVSCVVVLLSRVRAGTGRVGRNPLLALATNAGAGPVRSTQAKLPPARMHWCTRGAARIGHGLPLAAATRVRTYSTRARAWRKPSISRKLDCGPREPWYRPTRCRSSTVTKASQSSNGLTHEPGVLRQSTHA